MIGRDENLSAADVNIVHMRVRVRAADEQWSPGPGWALRCSLEDAVIRAHDHRAILVEPNRADFAAVRKLDAPPEIETPVEFEERAVLRTIGAGQSENPVTALVGKNLTHESLAKTVV